MGPPLSPRQVSEVAAGSAAHRSRGGWMLMVVVQCLCEGSSTLTQASLRSQVGRPWPALGSVWPHPDTFTSTPE